MIETACKLKRTNLEFIFLNINKINFIDEFDLIFSNATLHWVKDYTLLLNNVYKNLKKNGVIRFNFAGNGNCSNFLKVIKEVIENEKYKIFFDDLNCPWYMPGLEEYKQLLNNSKFRLIKVWKENKDRFFKNSEEMKRWIEQSSIIPFLEKVNAKLKNDFKKDVFDKMIKFKKNERWKMF